MGRSIRMLLAVVLFATALAVGTASPPPVSAATTTCQISTPSSAFAQPVKLAVGHARVWRLYQAFFLRQPDSSGLRYWLGVRSHGLSHSSIAYYFSTSKEFRTRYGSLSHGAFVDLVYRNVLCRKADASGRAYWLGLLQSGALTRWDMVVNFTELREYLTKTKTCHSIYPAESSALTFCPKTNLTPLAQATLTNDGYQERYVVVPRRLGGSGAFRGVEVVFSRRVFETGANRCSVASINGNWLVESQKDAPNPSVLGLGLIDGVHARGSSDRTYRGVFGLRFDANPTDVVEVWPGDTKSSDDRKLSSVMHHAGQASLESWHAAAEMSPYLTHIAPHEIVHPDEWVWAAAGIPLRIDGQTDSAFTASYGNDPYTHQTLRHSFVAFNQDTGRLIFAATQSLDTWDLVNWARNNGYEDLIKFDGGGSMEFNIGRKPVVGGTSRDIPVWLGIGC